MLNVRCRKFGVEKIKDGRRSYISLQQLKTLRGSKTTKASKDDDTKTSGVSGNVDERLIQRLADENEYLRKKLDEEGDKVKGSLNVIFQQTERISKLETENTRLLPYAPPDVAMENKETESEPIEVINRDVTKKESIHDKEKRTGKKAPWWDWWINPRRKGRR